MMYPVLPLYQSELAIKSVRVIEPPISEPITLDLARQHLRLDTYGSSPEGHYDDELIQTFYLPAAREYCELLSGRALARQQLQFDFQSFPQTCVAYARPGIKLPLGPALSLVDFVYTDGDGVVQTISEGGYQIDLYRDNGYIYPPGGQVWPTTQLGNVNAVSIRYIAGYDDDAASPLERKMPIRYKQAILLMLGHFYENRSETEVFAQVPKELALGVRALLMPDALRNGFA